MHLITDLFFFFFSIFIARMSGIQYMKKWYKIHLSTNIKQNTIDNNIRGGRKEKIRNTPPPQLSSPSTPPNNNNNCKHFNMISWWIRLTAHPRGRCSFCRCDVHDVQVMNGILIVSFSKQSAQHEIISSCWPLMFTCLVIKGNVGYSVYLMQKSFIPLSECALLWEAAHIASPACVCVWGTV